MFEIVLLNEKGQKFVKPFAELPAARKFYQRCRRSKKLTILSYNFDPNA